MLYSFAICRSIDGIDWVPLDGLTGLYIDKIVRLACMDGEREKKGVGRPGSNSLRDKR